MQINIYQEDNATDKICGMLCIMERKKCGLVTIVDYLNYGNRLQNIAVAELLKEINVEVETLDIFERQYYSGNVIKKIIKYCLPNKLVKRRMIDREIARYGNDNRDVVIKRYNNFKEFSKKNLKIIDLNLKRNKKLGNKIVGRYDVFFAGSDQIWNPYFAATSHFFLEFADKKPKVSISASIGITELSENTKNYFRKMLRDFRFISVREKTAQKYLREKLGLESFLSYDPTLLAGRDFWKQKMKSPEGFERDKTEDYILAFFIGENNSKEYSKRYRELISCCEKKYKKKVICLNDLSAPENYAITPDELLFYISEAKIVLTNSFHISVFSILFQRQFFVVDRNDGAGKNMGSRLWDLLNEFGLENRIINANSKKEIYEFMSKKIKEISDEDFVSIEIKCKKNKDELLERISRIL